MSTPSCPLCNSQSSDFFKDKFRKYFLCSKCKAIFVDILDLPDENSEFSRYEEHNNDVNDVRYQDFVRPIVNKILTNFSIDNSGLDFGAGNGPVISKLLKEKDYNILQYDPFYHNNPELLKSKYDYIVCCEVVEHFHYPVKDFKLLKNMLTDNGKLYVMTSIYNDNIDFKTWFYKNDRTHVIFYQVDTLNYICNHFNFSDIKIEGNLITFSN